MRAQQFNASGNHKAHAVATNHEHDSICKTHRRPRMLLYEPPVDLINSNSCDRNQHDEHAD